MICPRCHAIVWNHAGRGNHPHEEMGEEILICMNGHSGDSRRPSKSEITRGHKGTVSRKHKRHKPTQRCSIEGCTRLVNCMELCRMHYQQDYLRRKKGMND